MIEAEPQEYNDNDESNECDDEYVVTLDEIKNTLKDEKESGSDIDDDDDDNNNKEDRGRNDKEIVNDDKPEEEEESVMDDIESPHCRGTHLVSLFVRTFFRTIRRDWHLMDKYRVDKFYTLIRTMIHEIYEYMAARCWNYGIMLMLNDAVFDEILKQPPNGLRYHLIDICLEELAKVNCKAKIPLAEDTFLEVLEPFFGL